MNELMTAFVAGFLIAAPVGTVGVLCIQRTLLSGLRSGLVSGLGAALADTLYGALAAFSIVGLSAYIEDHEVAIRIGGASVILTLGIVQLLQKKKFVKQKASVSKLGSYGLSSFFITLTNPLTILAFMAVFSAGYSGKEISAWITILGVFLGAMTCWCAISLVAFFMRTKIADKHYSLIHKGGAVLILIFGFYLLLGFGK